MTQTPLRLVGKPINILLVEDSPGDAMLVIEALRDDRLANTVSWVVDGVEAMEFLYRKGRFVDSTRPDIILLDLNLPKKDGRQVLEEIKLDDDLKLIPVVILTTSNEEEDVLRAYDLHANAYVTKPVDFDKFLTVVRSIEDFWLTIVKLPHGTVPFGGTTTL